MELSELLYRILFKFWRIFLGLAMVSIAAVEFSDGGFRNYLTLVYGSIGVILFSMFYFKRIHNKL